MRKSLRNFALAAMAALPFAASADITITPVWVNGVTGGVADPIPGLDADWDKPTPTHQSSATATRFGTGKDGKLYVNSHKDNAIMTWDGKQLAKFFALPAVTDDKWNGTAIATDDAGNIIFNFCFTDPTKSFTKWAVLKDGVMTEIELSTPVADLKANGRLDIISHIVGDVTSEKGGVGYSTLKNTDHLVMFHFKGDGTKVTSLTAKASSAVPDIDKIYSVQTETYQAAAKYTTIDEILASSNPENEFYLAVGARDVDPKFTEGVLANFNGTEYEPLYAGNVGYGATATMVLGGQKYIIRNYSTNPGSSNVMTFGVYDLDGELVASWTGSELTDYYGSETLSVEQVDENTANLYLYVAIGKVGGKGAFGGMFTITEGEGGGEIVAGPDGTQDNPYLIATAEDLCNAWQKTVPGKLVYFKQTADIDMAGVKDYTSLTAYAGGVVGDYSSSIYYDGDYHVIYNFAPVDRIAGTGANAYYNTSLFGTPSGTIKNLGVVNAEVTTDWYEAGILGGFAGTGQHTATAEMNIDNVFVTGKLTGTTGETFTNTVAGGMFGTSGQPLNITNSYVQIAVNAPGYAAGFIAKAGAAVKVANSYASATVSGATTALAVATDDKAPAAITFDNVVAFGTGVAANVTTTGVASVVPALDANGIATVQGWAAFNSGDLFMGLPALNWQANIGAGFNDAVVDSADVPAVYYNLQGVEVANPDNGVYIVRRGNKVAKELIRK